jgi:hypothetical protein
MPVVHGAGELLVGHDFITPQSALARPRAIHGAQPRRLGMAGSRRQALLTDSCYGFRPPRCTTNRGVEAVNYS